MIILRLNLKMITDPAERSNFRRYLPIILAKENIQEEMIIYNLQLPRNIPEPLIFNITEEMYF